MPRYNLKIVVTADNITQVKKLAAQISADAAVAVEKVKLSPSRSDRLMECSDAVTDAASEVECLREELQEWRDSIPENLNNGEKASQLDDAISELDDIHSSLDSIRWEVDFPGMF